ncbi:alpha-2-macroglobulin family protein [Adhaeribacter radiodurans]|uniref:Alpha-2-macroglobulin family protein n=1 Tax=Adhaeribacter radiodurans TaxID=2745197 RepID=A0A7L7L934_9BACT|nr:MG2 domain-containing protein [Adhaeribacter radiodurans]QMU29234.1 alpha-2-macroglobulin family protein [Adhaeribacter radiodurans]
MKFPFYFRGTHAFPVWFLVVLCLLVSCRGNRNELRLESKNFEEQIEQEQNLVFTFDKELAPPAILQKWDTVNYLNFTPKIKGRFKWTAPNELVFSPLQSFAPSTDFQAELTDELLKHSPKKYSITSGQTIRFHTPYLDLPEAQAFWGRSASSPDQLEARVRVAFNYPVTYAALRNYLQVSQGPSTAPVPVELVNSSPDYISLRVKQLKNSTQPLRIQVKPGLITPGSQYRTNKLIEKEVVLPNRQLLQVSEVTTGVENGEEQIYVATTQPVQTENLRELVKLRPEYAFTVEEMEGGFVLQGNLPQQTTYDLVISKNLTGLEGAKLGQEYVHPISFASVRPGIAFANTRSVYLSSQGARNIALNINKIPRFKVSIGKIYENNILRALQEGKMYEGEYDEAADEYYSSSSYPVNETNGTTIFEREYETNNLRKQGNSYLLNLNLDDLDFDSEFKGLYVLTVTSTEQKWLRDSKLISVSDIGLIAKQGKNDVIVFANSIREAKVQSGVEVRFISTSNQVIYKGTTDKDGVVRFANIDKQAPDFKLGLVTARLGQDFTYLPYSQTQVNTSRFEVGGKRLNDIPYDAFIYGDRDLYRPGDVIHLNTVVRTPTWKTVAGLPIKLKLLLPNGKEYRSAKAKLNQSGAAESSFILPAAAVTGTYTVEVYSGNEVLLNSKKIGVEEFIPDRLKVTAALNKPSYNAGESVVTKFTALNLFGPPAAGRNYEMQLSLKKKVFEAKKYPEYIFDLVTSGSVEIQNSVRQGQTNAQGEGQESFTLADYRDIGLLDGSVYTTVFDETDRPVNRLSKFEVSTQPVFYGMRNFEEYVSTRQPLRIPLIAVDKTGQAIAAQATVQLVRFTYESVIERSPDAAYNYKSQRKESIVNSRTISIPAGGAPFEFTPVASGDYEIRIMRPGASNFVAQEFYAYGFGDTESTSFEVNNEGEIDITLDKPTYEVGDEAKVLFKAPFAGKILVTVERDKVLSYYYLQTDKKAASLTLPIKENYLPTLYITATALRPVKDNSLPLTVARGFMPVTVTKKSTKLDVAITAAETSRSQRTQEIKVRTAPNAEVTLAVVDEGILQLKDYQTPDPYGFFYQKRALEVNAYDLYPFLFPELTGKRSSFGGDGYDLEKRINPLTSKRVKLVAQWSGHLKTGSNGEATIKVNIPQFSGSLRVMAVAYKENAFGSADKIMRVADPVVISTALPRFVSPKDTILVPVTLSNTTAKATAASTALAVTGSLRVVGTTTSTATLGANKESMVVYKVVAAPAIGQASVTVNVKALGESFSNRTDITIRPPASLTKITSSGSLKGSATADIKPTHDFLLASLASRLVISKSPVAEFTDDITYLLQYPYGCLEQTVSTAFPLLYYSDLARVLNQDRKTRTFNPNYLVQEAITKMEGMQQYDGGFTYWPGEAETHWWTSAYATHFLLEARKAGYPVNAAVLDKVLIYLQRKVKGRAMEEYRFYDTKRQLQSKFIAAHEITYSLYVLSVAGKTDWATMNYYKSKPDLLALDEKYVLASTFALSGNRESFTQLLPANFSGQTSERALNGSFYSALRDRALALNGLIEADPDNPQVGILARHLSGELRSNRWFNTQERAFALLALGKIARRGEGNVTAKIYQNGKVIGTFTGKDVTLTNKLNRDNTSIRTTGQGTLYYFWEVEGIPQSGTTKEEDSFLQVRKTFFDRNGNQITRNIFRQNDLIVVRIALQTQDSRNIPNVAITDLLPAGFEIENPRLTSERELAWAKDVSVPDHTDIRDDRINIYTTATAKPKYFYYQVRAVSPGTFQMGPVGADAMYNAEYHSYSGGGVVRVR